MNHGDGAAEAQEQDSLVPLLLLMTAVTGAVDAVLRRRWPEQDKVKLFNPATVAIVRYRYRGTAIPSPWATTQEAAPPAA